MTPRKTSDIKTFLVHFGSFWSTTCIVFSSVHACWFILVPFWSLFGSMLVPFWSLFGPALNIVASFWSLFGPFLVPFCSTNLLSLRARGCVLHPGGRQQGGARHRLIKNSLGDLGWDLPANEMRGRAAFLICLRSAMPTLEP